MTAKELPLDFRLLRLSHLSPFFFTVVVWALTAFPLLNSPLKEHFWWCFKTYLCFPTPKHGSYNHSICKNHVHVSVYLRFIGYIFAHFVQWSSLSAYSLQSTQLKGAEAGRV
ncbi:hypothetical protein TRVL_08853 [Trypanosoma vivax]|uniref:Uncharacterized protein n=1 Tax=Trypanosoma vivax (strain Y486) TaxID=1055687 RepID=G0U2Y2_TRYVY|nr:hypothetical protein TRVL_08853 [Trypanosoma vivax]CCC50636.1 hypothetical protein TVY486_0904570 [Trypanosoma vivax Y486]